MFACDIHRLLGGSIVNADESGPSIEVWNSASQANIVRGTTEPNKIPYFLKYAMFVTSYETVYRSQLVQNISSRDDAILNMLASDDAAWEEAEVACYSESFLGVCTNRGSKNAVTLARETSRIASDSNARRAARYRKSIESLSQSGRQTVEDFVESVVTPGIATVLPNEVDLAEAAPDEYMAWFDIECHLKLTGEYPADIQESLKRLDEE